jgi:hypothetical protein
VSAEGGGSRGRRWPSTQRPTVAWADRNGGRDGSSGGSVTASSHGTYGSADRNSTVGGRGATRAATAPRTSQKGNGSCSATV